MSKSNMTSLQKVELPSKTLEAYRPIVGDAAIDEAEALGKDLKGLRVLHLNSTASGGGVAELLQTLVPLEIDCGLDVEWRLLCSHEDLFEVTKQFHNALQGQPLRLTDRHKETYLEHNRHCAAGLRAQDYDVIVIHDPQPAAIPSLCQMDGTKWVWRCHIHLSNPSRDVWDFLQPYVQTYDAAVFTLPEFVPPGLIGPDLHFIAPAIDPLSPKNRILPLHTCRSRVGQFGIDTDRPLLIQVSRFDPWKDPWGVIQAFRLVREEMPEVQLALVGSMADDDPEGWQIYSEIQSEVRETSDIHLLTNMNGVEALEVNAFQRVANVVIQKSIREGFGLVVAEAVWKGTPVVGGNVGGIPLQIQDGIGGFLVDTVEQCAARVLYLLENPEESANISWRGRQRIKEQFLTPRLLTDELKLLRSTAGH